MKREAVRQITSKDLWTLWLQKAHAREPSWDTAMERSRDCQNLLGLSIIELGG